MGEERDIPTHLIHAKLLIAFAYCYSPFLTRHTALLLLVIVNRPCCLRSQKRGCLLGTGTGRKSEGSTADIARK